MKAKAKRKISFTVGGKEIIIEAGDEGTVEGSTWVEVRVRWDKIPGHVTRVRVDKVTITDGK